MNKWPMVGVLLILVGIALLAYMGGFIIHILETLLKLIVVLIGIVMVAAGVALLVGRRWMRRRPWRWGPTTSST